MEKGKFQKGLLIGRICLWIIALTATIYWIYYSVKLHNDGIFDPAEYSTALRPVLYTCLIISLAAVALSFALYRIGKKK